MRLLPYLLFAHLIAACDSHTAAHPGDLAINVDFSVPNTTDVPDLAANPAVADLASMDVAPPLDFSQGPDLNPCECWSVECAAEWHGDLLIITDMCRRRPLNQDAGEVCYCF